MIYFPGFNNIDIKKYVTFNEGSAYTRSRKLPTGEIKEPEASRVRVMEMEEETPEYHEEYDMTKPQEPIEPLHDKNSHKRRPAWA